MNIQGLPSSTQGLATAPTSPTAPGSSGTSGTTLNSNSAEQTFIQLLVTELQSQDPTSPMDPTTMVGQMFSMNQLQQLIDINQTLSAASVTTPSAGATPSVSNASSATAGLSSLGSALLQAAPSPANSAASYAQQLLKGAH